MRPLSLLFPASLLVIAASAGAQSLSYPRQDPAPITTVQVKPSANTFRLRNEQAAQIAGLYEMSNGWSVTVRPDARHIDVSIDRNAPLRLLAVSSRKFVSADGAMTMEFNRGNADSDMIMRYVPDANLAQVIVLSASMAQR